MKETTVLDKIEKIIDGLPYDRATVRIELRGKTLELTKDKTIDKTIKCGFGEH